MYGIVEYFANGFVFFVGAILISVAAILEFYCSRIRQSYFTIMCLVGVLLIIASATPFSYLYYAIGTLAVGFWYCLVLKSKKISKWKRSSFVILQFVIWFAILFEGAFLFYPSPIDSSFPKLIVFGDSVTAGMGGDKIESWPRILRREQDLVIQDLSQVGATVATALEKAKQNDLEGDVVVVEIGGNDLFGSTLLSDFEADLEELLRLLEAQKKVVYLFELPLIPFHNEYGRVQRRLSKKYNVRLIPKRVLMGILAGDHATIDSIHLTQDGHRAMAERVLEIVYGI